MPSIEHATHAGYSNELGLILPPPSGTPPRGQKRHFAGPRSP